MKHGQTIGIIAILGGVLALGAGYYFGIYLPKHPPKTEPVASEDETDGATVFYSSADPTAISNPDDFVNGKNLYATTAKVPLYPDKILDPSNAVFINAGGLLGVFAVRDGDWIKVFKNNFWGEGIPYYIYKTANVIQK